LLINGNINVNVDDPHDNVTYKEHLELNSGEFELSEESTESNYSSGIKIRPSAVSQGDRTFGTVEI
jgi:hypothetical protein